MTLCRLLRPLSWISSSVFGREIRFQVGIAAARIGSVDGHAVFVEPACEGALLDEEFDLEVRGENLMQRSNEEFVLTDRKTLHSGTVGHSTLYRLHLQTLIIRPSGTA